MVYEKERRHAVPVNVAATDMGYKNARSGTSLQALASIRYFGLMLRPKEGMLSVTSEVEDYKFNPSPNHKQELLIKWLRTPKIFSDLLDKFPDSLPSNAVIRYELIQLGFSPATADDVVSKFKQSVDFSRYYEREKSETSNNDIDSEVGVDDENNVEENKSAENAESKINQKDKTNQFDRIPIRLTGDRRAYIEIPAPFFEKDKTRIIAQIDLILTEEDNDIDG